MKFPCCDPRRLDVLKHSGSLKNAIDFVEVLDRAAPPGVPRQCTLFVRLLQPGFTLTPKNLRISGGERIRSVGVLWCAAADDLPPQAETGLTDTVDDLPRTLVVRTDGAGDFSRYTLTIVSDSDSSHPPDGFDPRLSSIVFSFKVECPTDFDCLQPAFCPPDVGPRPEIDYLAKDYQGFRRLLLDRLSLLLPGWTERSAADLGVTLVELLAYAADNLSYQQDAIATEAYLDTARRRESVRRHARLVDYFLHEGCNARALVHFDVAAPNVSLPAGTQLLTRTPGLPAVVAPDSPELRDAIASGAQVFETAHDALLDQGLNQLSFYTWGDDACCLPRGCTEATLRGHANGLRKGDILVLLEVLNPTTGKAEDADRTHRWAVRLTNVTFDHDPSGQLFNEPPVDDTLPVTEISWDAADALPFPLCLSAKERPGIEISVARGNMVLVDHGLTVTGESLGVVPDVSVHAVGPTPAGCDHKEKTTPVPPRFRPGLAQGPLTHGFNLAALLAVHISDETPWWPASALLAIDPRTASPGIVSLTGTSETLPDESWTPRRDLLGSRRSDNHFVVEVENDGRARLRFGDATNGRRPEPATRFNVSYRVGNGTRGNVGADSITHLVNTTSGAVTALGNPLPAAGGVEPEDIEVARRDAPRAFRTQERAVTAADYAAVAERRPDIQRAAATFRWTGSWYTVFVTADRFGGGEVDKPFAARLRGHLERFRMAGYDLDFKGPRYVPLDVALHVCVRSDYLREEVLQATARALSSEVLPDGRLGVFHPDNLSFGNPVYLSRVIAAAQAVEGVDSVRADRFGRLISPSPTSLDEGVIAIGPMEIAQLANNPNFPEWGQLVLSVGGGK